jgi:hypothetical protein
MDYLFIGGCANGRWLNVDAVEPVQRHPSEFEPPGGNVIMPESEGVLCSRQTVLGSGPDSYRPMRWITDDRQLIFFVCTSISDESAESMIGSIYHDLSGRLG